MVSLNSGQEQALAVWATTAAKRHQVDARVAAYKASLMAEYEQELFAHLNNLVALKVPKTRIAEGYGTSSRNTIDALILKAQASIAPVAVPATETLDPPLLTDSKNGPELTATVESEGFVRVTIKGYPHPLDPDHDPISVDDYRLRYEVRPPKGEAPARVMLYRADEREAPEGFGAVRANPEFRQAVAEAASIDLQV